MDLLIQFLTLRILKRIDNSNTFFGEDLLTSHS